MSNPNDDPHLTAYALGELHGTAKADIEARLAHDEDARRYVEQVRGLGEQLTQELAKESAPGLTERQKARVERQAKKPAGRTRLIINIAASVAIVGILAAMLLPALGRAREKSRRTSNSRLLQVAKGSTMGLTSDGDFFPSSAPNPGSGTPPTDREQYDAIVDNPFVRVADDPRSTFSIDVDTASYAIVRRFLNQYQRPVRGAVRIEELINYFDYDYAPPANVLYLNGHAKWPPASEPFAVHSEVNAAPWNEKHRLVKIGLKGRVVEVDKRPPSNLVFLLDVSGSMDSPDKLELVKAAMKLLLDRLGENDRVALVVYAGAAGMVLDSTPCDRKAQIAAAIDHLAAGGSTAGGAGIELAYKVARTNFITGGVNRVILCTDGDFNVGATSRSALTDLIERQAKSGVYLSIFGFGMGNYQDATMEELSNKGNGNYGYIDTISEARKALVEQMSGTLVTIAKDVKIQVEFNPARVAAFRLIGYENRVLAHRDFNDDRKDAGDIGAGHTVTALYEIVPAGEEIDIPGVDPLKYQKPVAPSDAANAGELMTVKLRYKLPDGDASTLMSVSIADAGQSLQNASPDFRFAAAVAMFGMILRDSEFKGAATLDGAIELARSGQGPDKHGYRAEFIGLAKKAKAVLQKD